MGAQRTGGFRPHSSPDPFGATLSPGEGILGRHGAVPYIEKWRML